MGDADLRRPLQRRREQRPVPPQPRQGPDRPVGRLRPADPDRLRPRPRAGPRRGRQGGRADLAHRRHAGPVRRHPAVADEHLDDDQRHRDVAARALPGGRRGAGRGGGGGPGRRGAGAGRHHPERHHQGVPLAGHLRLRARSLAAADHRHGRLHRRRDPASGTRPTSAATTCRRPARRRCRRSPTRCAPRSPCWMPCATPARCPRSASARSSPASRSSSTPACASSRRCARCAPSCSSGTS